jgi:hypothetical protein
MASWGTQTAIVVVPIVYFNKEGTKNKIRTGLTIATIRVLYRVVKCYRCHLSGHTSNNCTMTSPGKELCRKCGARDYAIANCTNEPCCPTCSKETSVRINHVTGSLASPMYRKLLK